MNSTDNPDRDTGQGESIADRNVEQLVSKAYQPKVPDADFAQRVEDAVVAKASRHTDATVQPASVADREARRRTNGPTVVMWVAALSLIIGVFYLATRPAPEKEKPLGSVLQLPADVKPAAEVASQDDQDNQPGDRRWLQRIGERGLVPRERPAAATPPEVEIGSNVETGPGERRRLSLPDGSILYVNENTKLLLEADRRIAVAAGEVFLEVAPAGTGSTDSQPARFVVHTPHRDVTALGTKFAVRVGAADTGVLVTQGKVAVSGVTAPILSGQQLRSESGTSGQGRPISPAPRSSHLLDWTRDLKIAAESPLVPASKHGGGALVAVAPNGQEAQISLRKYHIDIHIEDGFARTTIDQTYFNHEHWRLEGTFYFPLPPDASLSRLAMYVGGKLMEGGMAERDYARQVFETIKYRQLDPALLEWVDGSTFKMRVFPLEGRQEKRIILSYTQKLSTHYGLTRYRFPAGHNLKEVGEWSVQANVARAAGLDWKCPSHELAVERRQGDLVLTAAAKRVPPNRDIVIELRDSRVQATGQPSARFAAASHEGAQYLGLRFRPELSAESRPRRRDWIFLCESSADRDPLLARVQVDVIRTLLENAEYDDTFSILTAATRARAFSEGPLPATPDQIAEATEFLDGMHLVGALDLEKALAAATESAKQCQNPVLVHLGSGVPVLGERSQGKLLDMLPDGVTYVGVGVGKRFNRNFMNNAAGRTGGYFTQINPDEPVSWRAFELLATLSTPRLVDVKVTAGDPGGEQIPLHTTSNVLVHGEELCAIGRFESGAELPAMVTVTGNCGGKPFECSLPVVGPTSHANYLPRIWAKLEIDHLLADDAQKHKDRIIALSKAMYVMSPFTSLLVLENDEMYEQYKVDRGRKDHWALYPCPEQIEVIHEGPSADDTPAEDDEAALEDEPDDEPPEEPTEEDSKPSEYEVLDTILIRTAPPMFKWPCGAARGGGTHSTLDLLGDLSAGPYRDDLGDSETRVRHALQWLAEHQNGDDSWSWHDPYETRASTAMAALSFLGAGQRYHRPTYTFVPYLSDIPGTELPFVETDLETVVQSLQMIVTPRIIIQEEEEEKLGIRPPDDFDALIELITSTITPNAWEDVGGGGAIEGFATNLSLVVSQTQRVHDEVGMGWRYVPERGTSVAGWQFAAFDRRRNGDRPRLFAEGTSIYGRSFFGGPEIREGLRLRRHKFSPIQLARRGGVQEKILKELAAPTTFPSDTLSLQDAIDYFKDLHSIEIQLDVKSLEDVGVALDTRVRAPLPGATLRDALRRITRDLGLGYVLRNEVILISTPEELDNQLSSRVFSVGDLVLPPNAHGATAWIRHPHGVNVAFLDGHLRFVRENINLVMWEAMAMHDRRLDDESLDQHRLPWGSNVVELFHPDQEGYLVSTITGGLKLEHEQPDLLYHPPEFSGDERVFRDLVAYAPAMNTTLADVQTVVDKEARRSERAEPGQVDERARELIEKSRQRGWQAVTWDAGETGRAPLTVHVDGRGRYRYERLTAHGLREIVVCDGLTLRHIYPELGIGAERKMNGCQRREILSLVPWLLPPVGELSLGADLKAIDQQTVAVVPHGIDELVERLQARKAELAEETQDDRTENADEGAICHALVHLVFDESGRLAERRLVETPTGRTLFKMIYSADGNIRWSDKDGKQLGEYQLQVTGIDSPDMDPDTSKLVVLPMPRRSEDHLRQTIQPRPDGEDEDDPQPLDFTKLSEEDALQLIATNLYCGFADLQQLIEQRFFQRGDQRIGFYTILLSSLPHDEPQESDREERPTLDPPSHDGQVSLDRYIAWQLAKREGREVEPFRFDGPPDGFIEQLAAFEYYFDALHRSHITLPGETAGPFSNIPDPDPFDDIDIDSFVKACVDELEWEQLFTVIEQCHSPAFAFLLLRETAKYGNRVAGLKQRIADTYLDLEQRGRTGYVWRYERARALTRAKKREQAREIFAELYRNALRSGTLPAIDRSFHDAFTEILSTRQPLHDLMRESCDLLVAQRQYTAAILLTWQCRQLNELDLACELLSRTRALADSDDRLVVTLMATAYLARTGQYREADAALQSLLDDAQYSDIPELWQLASYLADKRGMLARSITCDETALDLTLSKFTDKVDIQMVRANHKHLLRRYQELARTVATLGEQTSADVVGRVVRIADRWRTLDDNPKNACKLAAKVCRSLGAEALAWDYLTTPLALRPNEATPWDDLAQALRRDGEFEMADRAYAAAFEAEGTNAQLLWDRAQLLESTGRHEAARKLFKQLAETKWQPRFEYLGRQAARLLDD